MPTIADALAPLRGAPSPFWPKGAFDIASLGTITGGGTGLPEAVSLRLSDELGVRYLEGWGMTETASMAVCNRRRTQRLSARSTAVASCAPATSCTATPRATCSSLTGSSG
ncbi:MULTISPECIES: hypothetical protein [unclassified Variovorax]|jgi:acyl-CoA synthetase (AMP-forming)/AMP-acid ligase II|uniref:hypothetical protein n=1 Tax=unclassified Variovorax TaxID=663243 RepID=UPI000D203745|nr:hypothetical protein [Variovorax sp. PMC12]AVQ85416.1 hypothetical protein C4F17_30835 [Variovorax sp. PMC12]